MAEQLETEELLKQVSRDFFEMGEALAFSEVAFTPLRCQAKIFGGDFEDWSVEIQKSFVRIRGLFDGTFGLIASNNIRWIFGETDKPQLITK